MERDRRRFVSQLAAGSALALAPGLGCARKSVAKQAKPTPAGAKKGGAVTAGRARVVLVEAPGVVGKDEAVDGARVKRMLAAGLKTLGRTDDAQAALSRYVRPVDRVGLKVNCLAGRRMSTRRELVEGLVDLLAVAGLPRNRAVVFDRADRDLRLGGFPLRTSGNDYLCLGNDRGGYEKELQVMPSGASRFSVVAARSASVLINLPILKDHGLAGVSGALKNNFGLVHNPNKFHLDGCDPHVAEVNARPWLRRKQKLVICDALRVQVEGGPAFHPAGAATRDAILLAEDPVALDVVAWELLEALRKGKKLPSLTKDKRKPVHILTAAKQGLGVGERARIELVTIKV